MIADVIECQSRLIAALDARDADAILGATEALGRAVELSRGARRAASKEQLVHGLKQADAARIRVKYLTSWNRQKIDRLAELRGQITGNIYAKPYETAK